jgi:WD40 repeat protein
MILTESWDSTARLWTSDGEALAVLGGNTGGLSSAVFNPDGDLIVIASGDNIPRLGKLYDMEQMIQLVKEKINLELDLNNCIKYLESFCYLD